MNNILDFYDFLKHTAYRLTDKGKIRRNSLDGTRLTSNSITITQIDFDSFNGKLIDFDVSYKISVSDSTNSIIVTRMPNGQVDSEEWDTLFSDIDFSTKKSEDIAEIKSLFKHYFKKAIAQYLKGNPAATHFTGWVQHMDGFTYLPLGDFPANANVLKTKQIFFNHYLNNREFHSSLNECCEQTNNFQPFFDFIFSDKNIFTVFAYGLHSVLFDYLSEYRPFKFENVSNTDTALFSLCMYGDNVSAIKIIANILLNFFEIDANNWKTIKRDVHISASSLSTKNFDRQRSYMSVPILITSKKNNLTKASSIIKKINNMRERGTLHAFPVYINRSPILADEILNCNLNFVNCDNLGGNESLSLLHLQFLLLVYYFILFLIEISNSMDQNEKHYNFIHASLYNTAKLYALSNEWLEENLPSYLLFNTMNCFCYFLLYEKKEELVKPILTYAVKAFLLNGNSSEATSSSLTAYKGQQADFLKHFALFLLHQSKSAANSDWLFSGTEKRGNKEECYYLRQKDGFKKFQEYLNKKKLPSINQRNFDKMLRDHGLLKLPASGKSNTLCRGNKEYYYVLYKDKVSLFLNENFQK